MDEARRLSLAELREVVRDADELRKGTELFDKGGLLHLARHGDKVFAEARGSGPAPYRVTVSVGPTAGEVKARCSCFAARTRPFCKHAAALVVAWARAPESFVASDAPPAGMGDARKKAVRTGKTEARELMATGVGQVATLVRELSLSGVASLAADRPVQVRALGETLRDNRLRRLSARTLELSSLLERAAARQDGFPPLAYADLLADMLLTARKLEKHVAGEPLEDRHVEELVGRTWRKADRRPVAGLDLVEYAFLVRTTSDEFLIRESRLFDLASGTHYSEKQILPGFLVKRTEAKRSHAGLRLRSARAFAYPGYPPLRLELEDGLPADPLLPDGIDRLVEASLADVGAALQAFQEQRKDVFAPDRVPVALRATMLVAQGARLRVVDEQGGALHLSAGAGAALEDALEGVRLLTLLGDLDLEGVLPVLDPLAAVVEGASGTRELRALAAAPDGPVRAEWASVARAAGVSAAALSLGEVREELASALVGGLAGLVARVSDPLAARLDDLGLQKPAALLRQLVAEPDASQRLDDFVKLYQVLGLGVVRLAGAGTVDRAGLVSVPDAPALYVTDPGTTLDPGEVSQRRVRGVLGRLEASVHRARWFEAAPPESLLEILPHWADGAAAPHVARALRSLNDRARATAEEALSVRYGVAAAVTGVRVLHALGDPAAEKRLEQVAREGAPRAMPANPGYGMGHYDPDRTLWAVAAEALDALALARGAPPSRRLEASEPVRALSEQLLHAGRQEARIDAAQGLVKLASRLALPALRQSWRTDPVIAVRVAASRALCVLGDLGMVEAFVDALVAKAAEPDLAKAAAYALGGLGDRRGVAALIDALAQSFKPSVVIEALMSSGLVPLALLVERVAVEPELGERRAFVSVLEKLPAEAVAEQLAARAAGLPDDAFTAPAAALLKLASSHAEARRAVARVLLGRPLGDGRADKALRKAATAALA